MSPALKIVAPMAGYGARLRPHTWSKPKQLIEIAGLALLDHILGMLHTLPSTLAREFIFITGYLGGQIRTHMETTHPELPVRYVEQAEMRGQSDAVYQARALLDGPVLLMFPDTLIETDLGFLAHERADAVAWVREVPDPRRFGVVHTDAAGRVVRLVEKPSSMEHRLAVVGFYYFADGARLIAAIEAQMDRGLERGGEFYLADAANLLLEEGLRMRIEPVTVWLDAGTVEAALEANAYLLANGYANHLARSEVDGVAVLPPSRIDPSAQIENAVIGPYASIGAGCRVRSSVVRNSILEAGADLEGCELHDSLVGRRAKLRGLKGIISVADDSWVSSDSS